MGTFYVSGSCSSGSCGYSGDVQWSGPGCQEGDVAYGKKVYLANHLNESGAYLETANFIAGSGNNMCRFVDEALSGPTAMSWFIDLGRYYLVETTEINATTSVEIYSDVYNLCYGDLEIILYVFGYHLYKTYCDYIYFRYLYYGYIDELHCYKMARFVQLQPYCFWGVNINLPICDVVVLGKPEVNINCSNCLQNPESLPCGNGIWCEHCKPGWLPPDCQKPCEVGYYGVNCLQKCEYHCMDISCDAASGVIADPNLCAKCELWYINPHNLCTDYIEKLEPYTNAITEVDVGNKNITLYISHDSRISNTVSNYYNYYIEYSLDDFSSYKTFGSQSHIQTADHFNVTFTNAHPSDVKLWVRIRLFREQNGVKETGADPVSVLIPRICSPSIKSDKCQTLTFSCNGDCDVDHDNNDDMSIMYKTSEDTIWVSTPVNLDSCPMHLTLHDGGRYDALLSLISHQNGVLVKVASDMMIIDVDKCMESTSGTSNQHTVIIVVVFLMLFAIATTILAIVLCRKGKYYTHIQNICEKKQPDNVQRDQPGQQYENVSYTAESKNVNMPKNVSTQDNRNAYEYTNKAFERSQSLGPKNVKVDVIDNRIYANSDIEATGPKDTEQEENAYLELSNNDSHQQTPSYYEPLSRR